MTQIGAAPPRMGPPRAASGRAGDQWGRPSPSPPNGPVTAPPLKPMLPKDPTTQNLSAHPILWNVFT